MSQSTWTSGNGGDWNDADNWSPAGIPSVNSDVVIATGAPVASASIGTVNSITDSSELTFRSAGTNSVTTFLDNKGHLYVDRKGGAGGTILNIGGTLNNAGLLQVGNASLSAPDEVMAAALDNTGKILLNGSSANQALLDVNGTAGFGAAGVMSGYARLDGDSAIEFASGEITSLAASAQLLLHGNDAFIEDSKALGSNSALTGLASIGDRASFSLRDEAAVSTNGALVNDGHIRLDFVGGDGGSRLTVGRTLTNNDFLTIGNATLSASDKVTVASLDNTGSILLAGSGTHQALLDVTGTAGFGMAGVLSGYVQLSGDSAIEFASGQITSLGGSQPSATGESSLILNGSKAFIEDSKALGSNSALAGLASIERGPDEGFLVLLNGASVSTTGALVNNNVVEIDDGPGAGGSSLTVAGALTNNVNITVGYSSARLSAPYKVTAASLDNTGQILVYGSGAVSVSGPVNNGTNDMLSLYGGATMSTTGSVTNSGELYLDASSQGLPRGGSTLSIGGR
jgi:hypothetical protein